VLGRLGEPLYRYVVCQGRAGAVWSYTDSPVHGGFLLRIVDFNAANRVKDIRREVYFPLD